MKEPHRFMMVCVGAAALALLGLSACGEEDVTWETTTSTVGAKVADQEVSNTRWRSYRLGVVSGLDVMTRSLESARREATVADRSEIDALKTRVSELRGDMIAEIDEPAATAATKRAELEASFGTVRADVEALLTRLGHSPEEFREWRGAD